MAVGVNIYPPVLDTYMPAFLKQGEDVDGTIGYKIYLSLSDYNKFEEVENNVQITLVRQDTNKTALLPSAASSGIKITKLNKEEDEEGIERYYVIIETTDLITDGLITNLFYKVQIRFTSTTDQEGKVIPQQSNPVDANWYTKYLDCFSEWSTVCLIKGIETPQITLTGLSTGETSQLKKPTLDVIGSFSYVANSRIEKETLKSYQLLLYDNKNNLIENSGEILSNQNNMPNRIAYTFNSFLENSTYQMKLIYTTTNLYTNKNNPLIYNINVNYDTKQTDFIVSTVLDNEDGIIQVQITLEDEEEFQSKVILRRTSSRDNFKKWETIHTFDNRTNKHIFNDMTVESGIIYKYYAYYDKDGYSAPSHITDGQMICLDFILLTTKEKQLKIYLDGKINSIQYTIAESKTDTIGGKYPIIRKNGNLRYRTLPIEGTIHSYMDDTGRFYTKKSIYGENKIFYDEYNIEHNITELQDYIYERFFREKVIDFLLSDQAVLLRTPSEGNLIVKCINNSFSPNTQLNNLIYKFTTNAVELDDCNLDNIKKYSLLKETGEDTEIFKKTVTKSSVLNGKATNIFDSMDRG